MLKLLIEYDTHRISHPGDCTAAHLLANMRYQGAEDRVDIVMLEVLAENEYNLEGRDHRNLTPLHIAARAGKLHTVQYLLDAGVDLEGEGFMDSHAFGDNEECWERIVQAHYRARRVMFARRRDIPHDIVERVFSNIGLHDFV